MKWRRRRRRRRLTMTMTARKESRRKLSVYSWRMQKWKFFLLPSSAIHPFIHYWQIMQLCNKKRWIILYQRASHICMYVSQHDGWFACLFSFVILLFSLVENARKRNLSFSTDDLGMEIMNVNATARAPHQTAPHCASSEWNRAGCDLGARSGLEVWSRDVVASTKKKCRQSLQIRLLG